MARIELSNIGGGGTTLSLTTTGTSGASTLAGSVLNIPVYQGQLTLTNTGTSGAATLVGNTLNIPNYATGGNPAGSAGQVQFNSTPSGSFAASANLAWDDTAVQLNINAPSSPTGKLNVKGSGATSSTVNTMLTDSGNTELLKVLDNGSTNIGANFNWDNVNGRLGLGTSTPNQTLEVSGAMRLTGTAGTAAFMLGRNSAGDVSTVTLGTTGTSGAATLSANVLNIPQYQGAVSLTTSGTSGASTFAANVLNIPQYQGALTLTTAGTSGAATLSGTTLNIPIYSGGGGTPAGSTGEIQYNNAGAFGASANLAWVNSPNPQLNIGAPSAPTARLNVRGGGTTSATTTQVWTNSGNTELMRLRDDGNLGIGTSTPGASLQISSTTGAIIQRNSTNVSAPSIIFRKSRGTEASPTAVVTGDLLGAFNFSGYMTNSAYSLDYALFGAQCGASPGSNNLPTNIFFKAGSTESPYNCQFYIHYLGNSRFGSESFVSGSLPTPNAKLEVIGANTTSGVGAFLVQDGAATPATIYRIDNDGKITYRATNTAAGTTGAQTINRPSGTVNFGIGATSLVVTNSLCTTASLVFAEVRTNDVTAQIKNVVPAAGSFTINLSAAATAETSVGFFIIN